jgi:hypothetical protein
VFFALPLIFISSLFYPQQQNNIFSLYLLLEISSRILLIWEVQSGLCWTIERDFGAKILAVLFEFSLENSAFKIVFFGGKRTRKFQDFSGKILLCQQHCIQSIPNRNQIDSETDYYSR